MRRYHLTTFGCQMNAHDSERIKGMLESLGLGEAPAAEEADVLVFNTCTIREKPDTKLAAYLGDAAARKRRDPDLVVAVGGCYAEAQRERIFDRYPFVDVAFGPGSIPHLGDWLTAGGFAVPRGRFGSHDTFAATLPMHRERRASAWVQVSMGCNSKCAYCIVPAVRGREQSRRPGEIVAEVESLARDGVREITLLGQNVNSWGRDLAPVPRDGVRRAAARLRRGRRDRADPVHEPAPEGLPRAGDRRDGRVRGGVRARPPPAAVRLLAPPEARCDGRTRASATSRSSSASGPRSPTSRSERTSSSASPARRRTTSARPWRSSRRCGFDSAFTFVYSPRAGTEAAALADQVPEDVKRERMERLVTVVQRGAAARNAARVGLTEEVLVEGPSRTDATLLRGRTRRNTTVNFAGAAEVGELVEVTIEGATSTTLRGRARSLVAA